MDPTDSSAALAASTSSNHTIPKTPTTSTTNLETLSVVDASGSGTTSGATASSTSTQKGSNEYFFVNWICGNYDMKWLSHEQNQDLRAAEKAKLGVKELEALGFTEPY